jgi:hypothetical protein
VVERSGHTTKHDGYKAREVGQGGHHAQRYLQRKSREKSCQWRFSCRLYFSFDLQGIGDLGCPF